MNTLVSINGPIDLNTLLTLVVSVFLPLITALVTKKMATSGLKAVTLLLLTAVSSFVSELITVLANDEYFDVGTLILKWIISFIVAVAAYFGFWNPTRIAETIQNKTAGAGIGRPKVDAVDSSLPR